MSLALNNWALGKNFSRRHFEIFVPFFQKIGLDISCKLSPPFGDNLYETSKPVFWEKYEKYFIESSAENFTKNTKC